MFLLFSDYILVFARAHLSLCANNLQIIVAHLFMFVLPIVTLYCSRYYAERAFYNVDDGIRMFCSVCHFVLTFVLC
jgi:hypothetical protein